MLNEYEKKRKQELLSKYNSGYYIHPDEAKELQELIRRDDEIDNALKLLILFALGVMIYKSLKNV